MVRRRVLRRYAETIVLTSTSGGAGGTVTTVTTLDELTSAVEGDDAKTEGTQIDEEFEDLAKERQVDVQPAKFEHDNVGA